MWVALKSAGNSVVAFGGSAAVAWQCRKRSELGRYPAGTRTCHQQYGAWLAVFAVSVARPGNNDHRPLRLAQRKKSGEQSSFDTATERFSEHRATAQQDLSRNAALPCVTGCVDAVFLPIVRWSVREHFFFRKTRYIFNTKISKFVDK